ncbi:winged helix-turn-helix domain-containing protein [Candidatus Woesearchaeota archaeon]|nr:winged helix-turn-helix domain-containing protein [Candidatus Woesearchaeota archaeon]
MGILDIFKTKDTQLANKRIHAMHNHVSDAFSSVQNQFSTFHAHLSTVTAEINKQKEWLKYLHQNHLSLHNQHTDHKEGTKGEIQQMNSWITYLHKSIQKQEKQIGEIQKAVEQTTKQYDQHFNQVYDQLEKTHKKASEKQAVQVIEKEIDHDAIAQRVLQQLNLDVQALQTNIKKTVKSDVYDELLATMTEEHNKHKEAVEQTLASMQQQEDNFEEQPIQQPVSQPTQLQYHQQTEAPSIAWASQITNPEQKLLNLLMSEADPMTYTKVSQLTGHSINTIRVNMNSLKKKGVVEESTLPSGVKLFSVTNKEKIKKMYNVHVL